MFAALVSCTGLEPSAFITHTCLPPLRSLVKAIFEPSGDQAGSASYAGLLVSRVSGFATGL